MKGDIKPKWNSVVYLEKYLRGNLYTVHIYTHKMFMPPKVISYKFKHITQNIKNKQIHMNIVQQSNNLILL